MFLMKPYWLNLQITLAIIDLSVDVVERDIESTSQN